MKTLEELEIDIKTIKRMKNKQLGYFMFFCYKVMQKYANDNERLCKIAKELDIELTMIVHYAKKYEKASRIVQELGFNLQDIYDMQKSNKDFEYFCYTIYQKFANDYMMLNLIATTLEIRANDIEVYAKRYKNEDSINYQNPFRAMAKKDMYIKRGYNEKHEDIIKMLLTCDNQDELNTYLYNNLSLLKDKRFIASYIINMYPKNAKKILERVNDKLRAFKEYLNRLKENDQEEKNEKKERELSINANYYQQQIMRDDTSKSFYDFSIKNKIDRKTLSACIGIWKQKKENGQLVYNILLERLNTNRKNYYNQFNNLIDKVLPLVNSYIKVGNAVRKFDIVDLFTYFGNDLSDILSTLIENYSDYTYGKEEDKEIASQISRLKKLIRDVSFNYTNLDKKDYHYSSFSLEQEFIDMELKKKTVVQQDQIVDDHIEKVPYLVSSLEKEEIFDTLMAYKIPVNSQNYDLMLKHINHGTIEIITRENIDYYLEVNNKKELKK